MGTKEAAAAIKPVRQTTQYNCMTTSVAMCLRALGVSDEEASIDNVNRVMGAQPMQGASWESAIACAQHYGMRVHLICPATLRQVKEFTDKGSPVMIAWNPEGREWSHASVIFDVEDDLTVHVADPNIPDPDETVRIVSKDDFYHKWFEKWTHYLVRRTAMVIEREISLEGRQMVASDDISKAKLLKTRVPAIDAQESEDPLVYAVFGSGSNSYFVIGFDGKDTLQGITPFSNRSMGWSHFSLKALMRNPDITWNANFKGPMKLSQARNRALAKSASIIYSQQWKFLDVFIDMKTKKMGLGIKTKGRPYWKGIPVKKGPDRYGWILRELNGTDLFYFVLPEDPEKVGQIAEVTYLSPLGRTPNPNTDTVLAIEVYELNDSAFKRASLSQPLMTRRDYGSNDSDADPAEPRPKSAYEVYVDPYGNACDDDGNCWTDKSSPSGTYGLHSYPGRHKDFDDHPYRKRIPTRSQAAIKEIREKGRGILLSMLKFGKFGSKEADFVHQMMSTYDIMSRKQADWFNSIYDRYQNFIRTIPKSLLEDPINIGTRSLTVSKDPKWEDWARATYEIEESGNKLVLLGPAKKVAPAATVRSDSYTPKQMEALTDFLAKRPGDKFMTAMQDLVEKGKPLSEAQLKAIRQNFYRAGMRQEADLFRPAGEAKTAGYTGNPDGKDIYPARIDHGYETPISGGSDIMQRLVKDLRREQGTPSRVAARYFVNAARKSVKRSEK